MNESEKSADLRPRLPWLSRVGTKNGELNSLGHLIRGAAALLALFNPVASAVMGLCMLLLSRTRVKGWWLWLGGGVATAVALITGWVAKYNTVWRELLVAVRQAVELRDPSVVGDVFADWPSLLLWQVPVGIALGVMLAGFRLSYRARYYAAWRPTVVVASERAVAKAARLIDTGTRRAVERPDDVVIRLGVDADTAKVFELPAVALRMHAVVAGPTGFGKSTTVQRMIEGLVAEPSARAAQIGALLIDMKGDPEMVAFLRGVAHAAGRPFYLVTERPETSVRYNPLRYGDAAQVASKLIETEAAAADGGFSEPHYRRLGERYLRVCASALLDLVESGGQSMFDGKRRPWRRDLPDLARLMAPGALGKQGDRLSPAVSAQVARYLAELNGNDQLVKDLYGMYNRYALMTEGPAGPILTDTADGLDIRQAILDGAVVAISLDAASDAATSRVIGNLAIQDVTHALASLAATGFGTRQGRMVWVGVDEFSALGGSLLTNLYARGRSAGAAVALASQDLDGDLNAVSPEFRTQVLVNANVVVLHQQRGESPDVWANALGTREVWKETLQVTDDISMLGAQSAASGVGSLREAHEFVVKPDTLRNLNRGEAIVVVGWPAKRIARVRIAQATTAGIEHKATDSPKWGEEALIKTPAAAAPPAGVSSTVAAESTNPWAAAVGESSQTADKEESHPTMSQHASSVIVDDLDEDDSGAAPVVEPVD